ncbi:MAG: SDR family oxidoreductase [Flavobacteriaceae bacterium]
MEFRLDKKVVVVTGASKGIGAGISKELALAGAIVMLCARSTEELNALRNEIEKENGVAHVFQLDIKSVKQIKEVFRLIYDQFGRIDILINNAGLGNNHAAIDVKEADWDEMMNVNLKGLFFCSQQAGKYMIKNGYGRIINMSSQASLVAIKDHAVYCASKGGVNLLTKVLALEWADKGITVNGIAPTFTYTPGTAERLDNPEYLASVLDRIPVGKVATIKDIVSAILYLSSTHSGMVTGSTLVIDGGWTVQ